MKCKCFQENFCLIELRKQTAHIQCTFTTHHFNKPWHDALKKKIFSLSPQIVHTHILYVSELFTLSILLRHTTIIIIIKSNTFLVNFFSSTLPNENESALMKYYYYSSFISHSLSISSEQNVNGKSFKNTSLQYKVRWI